MAATAFVPRSVSSSGSRRAVDAMVTINGD
jgi:hypothetical protein